MAYYEVQHEMSQTKDGFLNTIVTFWTTCRLVILPWIVVMQTMLAVYKRIQPGYITWLLNWYLIKSQHFTVIWFLQFIYRENKVCNATTPKSSCKKDLGTLCCHITVKYYNFSSYLLTVDKCNQLQFLDKKCQSNFRKLLLRGISF